MAARMNALTVAGLASIATFTSSQTHAQTAMPIDDVIMYGIDADTNELLRYQFADDTYEVVGTVRADDGRALEDMESLAYIPEGEHAGLYVACQDGHHKQRLAALNVLDATATVFPDKIMGGVKLIGMMAFEDAAGDWSIIGTTTSKKIIQIDPGTGTATELWKSSNKYEGLSSGPGNTVFGATKTAVYAIDLVAETETKLGSVPFGKIESLEYAFGDSDPGISVPGVPAAWTADGILFAFDDDSDALLIVDPAGSGAVAWDCSFATIDCEGLIFVTTRTDPYAETLAALFD